MAAITPATQIRENLGSLTLQVFHFSAAAANDTFAYSTSTTNNIVAYWTQMNDPTFPACAAVLSGSTFTFTPGNTPTTTLDLFVLSRI